MTQSSPIERKIAPQYDARGNPVWKAQMSAPDNSVAKMDMVPDRIIPVIFVPGVMGSNLKGIGRATGTSWTLNSTASMLPWLSRGPEARKTALTPSTMIVDDEGKLPSGTSQTPEELKRRGWGEVGAMSYSEFLVWLENALNDFDQAKDGLRASLIGKSLSVLTGEAALTRDEVALSYRYRFPVHACGYNWLDSNAKSGERLGKRIDEVIARYRSEKRKCEKVIVVTHSMGGLVARHCSEVLGYRDKIFGVVHGVMPAIGAAAVYRRFKAGTEGPAAASKVLGENAAEMTAVLSSAPGPMQLLPTPEYGNGWLKVRDGGNVVSLPQQGDPYGEIYTVRGKWWSMCEDRLINPLNKEADPKKRQAQVDADWTDYLKFMERDVKGFHTDIKQRYHATTFAFFGKSDKHKAYGTVKWDRDTRLDHARARANMPVPKMREIMAADDTPWRGSGATTPDLLGKNRYPAFGEGDTRHTESFRISDPDEPGDGTVPHRSGIAPQAHCRSMQQVEVEHEPAYKHGNGKDNERACMFTLRAIVQIAQSVQKTEMKYSEK